LNGKADQVTNDELDRIAKLSRMSQFFDKMENSWETKVGERGIKLSGGQRQRVGIARALIKNPSILIFDEATSSLDTENEARIRESIQEASVGKTTLIIAHRLATVRDADKIFVLDGGNIVGEGTHDELLASNEYYQRLVQNQVIMA
jgi:ABC-type multidrug transport system fused ATPase/permease subunit